MAKGKKGTAKGKAAPKRGKGELSEKEAAEVSGGPIYLVSSNQLDTPSESISLNFTKVAVDYTKQ